MLPFTHIPRQLYHSRRRSPAKKDLNNSGFGGHSKHPVRAWNARGHRNCVFIARHGGFDAQADRLPSRAAVAGGLTPYQATL